MKYNLNVMATIDNPLNIVKMYYYQLVDNKLVIATFGNITISTNLRTGTHSVQLDPYPLASTAKRINYTEYEQLLIKHKCIKF